MLDRVAIKAKAKEFAYNNKWNIWFPVLVMFGIYFAIFAVLGFFESFGITYTLITGNSNAAFNFLGVLSRVLQFVVVIVSAPISVGLASYLLKLVRTGKAPELKELFRFYRKDCMWTIILVYLVGTLIIAVMSCLLVIPGIIYGIKYALMMFIMAEQFDKEVKEKPENAFTVSEKLIDGHKWDYFVLQLSFIGWFILCELTLGILFIWIYPYYITTNVMWFDELKKISK